MLLDNLYKCDEGTVLGIDLVDIIFAVHPESKSSAALLKLPLVCSSNNISLDKEASGSTFVTFIKNCLKIRIINMEIAPNV